MLEKECKGIASAERVVMQLRFAAAAAAAVAAVAFDVVAAAAAVAHSPSARLVSANLSASFPPAAPVAAAPVPAERAAEPDRPCSRAQVFESCLPLLALSSTHVLGWRPSACVCVCAFLKFECKR